MLPLRAIPSSHIFFLKSLLPLLALLEMSEFLFQHSESRRCVERAFLLVCKLLRLMTKFQGKCVEARSSLVYGITRL